MFDPPTPSDLFSDNPNHHWLFIEARARDETVFDVHEEYSQFKRTLPGSEFGGLLRPGGFVTEPEGFETRDGERFVCFSYKTGEWAEFHRDLGIRFCQAQQRRWGEFLDGVLTLNDGVKYLESELSLIETNPPGKRASDRPQPTPEGVLQSVRAIAESYRVLNTKYDVNDRVIRDSCTFHVNQAVRFLRDLVGYGYLDVPTILSDSALDPIKDRPEFQELIASLGKPESTDA